MPQLAQIFALTSFTHLIGPFLPQLEQTPHLVKMVIQASYIQWRVFVATLVHQPRFFYVENTLLFIILVFYQLHKVVESVSSAEWCFRSIVSWRRPQYWFATRILTPVSFMKG